MTKVSVVILHGWGVNGKRYEEVLNLLKAKGFRAFAPDLPGFGAEPLRKSAMTLNDYVNFIHDFIVRNKMQNVVLIGHSFGGRIAIKLAAFQAPELKALILTGSAGIKPDLAFLSRFIEYLAISLGELFTFSLFKKFKNRIRKFLYFLIGEWDYYSAGNLRETFKKIIAEDLVSYLPKINLPTLIIWGEKDKIIPLKYGRKIEKLIPNARLIVVKDIGHKLPYQFPEEFVNRIISFLRKT